MFEPLVPQLSEIWGDKNLSFMFKLNNGTQLNWDIEKKETIVDIGGTMRVLIDKNEDALPVIDVDDIFNTFHSDEAPTVTNMWSYG
jgi:hypothetical protein